MARTLTYSVVEKMKNIKNSLIVSGLFVSLFLISAAIEGLVLSYLWLWFITPLGVKAVSIIHAIGICVVYDFISYHYYDYTRGEVKFVTSVNYILTRPVMAFVTGFILKFFI